MLSIPLFIKTDTRHLICRSTLLPAAMAHSGALSHASSRLRARLFPWFIPTLILRRIIIVSLIDHVIKPKKGKKLQRMVDAINTKNERNNASSLPSWISHFFLPLVFPHVSAFKSNLPVHTYPTYIRIISVTQDSSGSIGNWECVEVVIWNTIFTVQLTFAYSNLASTRFPVHSVFKNFHSWERIQKVADSYAGFTGYVWTKAKTGEKK